MNIDKLLELLNAEGKHWRNSANAASHDQRHPAVANAARIASFQGREEGFMLAQEIVRTWAKDQPIVDEALLERLIEFAELEARCPCCEGLKECVEECTFKDDGDSSRQEGARYALTGKEPSRGVTPCRDQD